MNTAIENLAQAKPYKPKSSAEDFEADKLAVLEALREAGARGVSTLEFIQRGIGGLRPPNRICDLRRDGHVIQTKHEGRRQFRFVLLRENPSPTPKPPARKRAEQVLLSGDWYERQTGHSRPDLTRTDLGPLFDGQEAS
jgi:hypothetical protein